MSNKTVIKDEKGRDCYHVSTFIDESHLVCQGSLPDCETTVVKCYINDEDHKDVKKGETISRLMLVCLTHKSEVDL